MGKAADLEKRLIDFSVNVSILIRPFADNPECRHLVSQLRRSASSPALNYGEAQSAESIRDFIHKLGIVVKELRETNNALRIIAGMGLISYEAKALSECNELISIFVASVKTAQQNHR